MQIKERALHIVEALETEYPAAECSLDSASALELLIATRLSAQCTDARVNLVTPELFKKYGTAEAFAAADPDDIGRLIYSCGFYKTKANDIVNMCKMLLSVYGGRVPDTIEELIKLPGVGRKTANLIVGDIYGKPSYVVDTHCIRITNLLGLAASKDPAKVEAQLRELIPPEKSGMFCHRLVWHGRAVCIARRPECAVCCLAPWCNSADIPKILNAGRSVGKIAANHDKNT
jgi:endonuclease-3